MSDWTVWLNSYTVQYMVYRLWLCNFSIGLITTLGYPRGIQSNMYFCKQDGDQWLTLIFKSSELRTTSFGPRDGHRFFERSTFLRMHEIFREKRVPFRRKNDRWAKKKWIVFRNEKNYRFLLNERIFQKMLKKYCFLLNKRFFGTDFFKNNSFFY